MEGFKTTDGWFVDRRTAAQIAFAAGQTHQLLDFLYSEELRF